jgi:hypothetical protein
LFGTDRIGRFHGCILLSASIHQDFAIKRGRHFHGSFTGVIASSSSSFLGTCSAAFDRATPWARA